MKRTLIALSLLAASPMLALAQEGSEFQPPHEFQAGTPARASEVNENFQAHTTGLDNLASRILTLESSVSPANVIQVATAGGDFESVAAALASITDASVDKPYLVQVAPGVYDETEAAVVPSFVILKGSGPEVTFVRSSRASNVPNVTAATAQLQDEAAIANLTIVNSGASGISIGVSVLEAGRAATLRNVHVLLNGDGGGGHFGLHAADSDVTVDGCRFQVSGANTVNSSIASTDSNGAFAQPLIVNCQLRSQGSTSGIGMQLLNTAATVRNTTIRGDFRAITANVAGISRLHGCEVATLGLNPVYEQTGSGSILSANTSFVGGNPLGIPSRFRYVHCYKSNFTPIVNGDGSTVQ